MFPNVKIDESEYVSVPINDIAITSQESIDVFHF